jgi:hypothetical protein
MLMPLKLRMRALSHEWCTQGDFAVIVTIGPID